MRRLLLIIGLLMLSVSARAQDITGSLVNQNDAVGWAIVNVPAVAIQVTNLNGQAVFEASADGAVTWWPVAVTAAGSGTASSGTTTAGLFLLQNAGYTNIRVRAASALTGTASVAMARGFVTSTSPAMTVAAAVSTPSAALVPARFPTLTASGCNALLRAAGRCQ